MHKNKIFSNLALNSLIIDYLCRILYLNMLIFKINIDCFDIIKEKFVLIFEVAPKLLKSQRT